MLRFDVVAELLLVPRLHVDLILMLDPLQQHKSPNNELYKT